MAMHFRKHISIILATLILLANLSLSFSVHYCNDEIASVSFQYQNEEPCIDEETVCCTKQDTHESCCATKSTQVNKTTDDVFFKTFQVKLQPAVLNTIFNQNLILNVTELHKPAVTLYYFDSQAPPLYKLYCQMVLYA